MRQGIISDVTRVPHTCPYIDKIKEGITKEEDLRKVEKQIEQ